MFTIQDILENWKRIWTRLTCEWTSIGRYLYNSLEYPDPRQAVAIIHMEHDVKYALFKFFRTGVRGDPIALIQQSQRWRNNFVHKEFHAHRAFC